MNNDGLNGIRDLNSLPFLVIPSKELTEEPEEYILGYVGDQGDTLVKTKSYDEKSNCKVEIKTEDNDNKALLNCIIEDYIRDENADILDKVQITKKKKRYHADNKEIIHHLLSELPEEKKEVKDISLIKKETDEVSDKSILIDLVPELPSEKSFQDLQKEVSLRTKQKNKRNVSNSERSPGAEVIQLDDDSLVSEGTDTVLEPEADSDSDYSPQFFLCLECGLGYKHKCHLKRHQSVAHNGFRLECNMCGEKFSRSEHLKRHIQLIHGLGPSSSKAQGHELPTAEPQSAAIPSAAGPSAGPRPAGVPSAAVPPSVPQPAAAPATGLEPVVSDSRYNAIAIQTDNAGHSFSMEETINCEIDGTSNNQTKQKVPDPLLTDSYCRMITRAILASPDRRVSLKELLSFISKNYPHCSKEPDGWQAPIKNYLCHSSHFVKALSKKFVEGSPEMWILNPATERKMIARYVRGSIRQKPVIKPGLGFHSRSPNVKTSTALTTALTNSTETMRQDKTANPNERSVNNLSYAKFKDSTTLNNSYDVNGIQIQKVAIRKENVSAPSFSKSLSSMSQKLTPSSKCSKPIKSYSALKSLYNLVHQKIADNSNTAMKKNERLSTVQKTSLVNSNKRGSINLSLINTSSSLLNKLLTEEKNAKKVENVPGHMLLECTEIYDISSGDENESCENQSPTIRNSCLETVTSNSNQCNTVSGNGIQKALVKASARSLNSPKPNGTFGQGNSCSRETTDTCSNSSTGTLLSDITWRDILNIPEPEHSVEVYEISSEEECT